MNSKNYLLVEDLEVYKKLCQLHIEICDLTHRWPQEEKYELGSQARRSSNSAPVQLTDKNDDRRWQLSAEQGEYGFKEEALAQGWPIAAD